MEEIKIQKSKETDVLYTVSEVAALLKVNKNYVYNLMKKNILKGLKLGHIKVTKKELDRFLDEITGKDLSDLDNIKDFSC